MLKISLIEIFLRGIPEAFLFSLAAYAFSGKKIEKKPFCITGVLLAVIAYLIRLLPISYGVHTILNIVTFVLLCVVIIKQDFVTSIKNGIIIFIIQFISEAVNIFVVQSIMQKDINIIFENPMDKLIYGIPSTIIVGIIVIGAYVISNKNRR